jgi:hypothetical protein
MEESAAAATTATRRHCRHLSATLATVVGNSTWRELSETSPHQSVSQSVAGRRPLHQPMHRPRRKVQLHKRKRPRITTRDCASLLLLLLLLPLEHPDQSPTAVAAASGCRWTRLRGQLLSLFTISRSTLGPRQPFNWSLARRGAQSLAPCRRFYFSPLTTNEQRTENMTWWDNRKRCALESCQPPHPKVFRVWSALARARAHACWTSAKCHR